MKPAFEIHIGSQSISNTAGTRLISLKMSASMRVPVNVCTLELSQPEAFDFGPGEEISVKLGYDAPNELVFTGIVDSIDWGITTVTIHAASSVRQLLTARHNFYFEQSKAGDLVSALTAETKVTTGTVDSGLEFATYALGNTRSCYDHLAHLARQCGVDVYADEKDQLNFTRWMPGTPERYQFGVNILSLSVNHSQPVYEGVDVFGTSPASLGEGSDASTWVTKKEVKGSSGSGAVYRTFDPTAKTQENAAQIAEALLGTFKPEKQGVMKTLGAPGIKLGATVQISNMPAGAQDAMFKVVGITHRVSAKQGFVTVFEMIENG